MSLVIFYYYCYYKLGSVGVAQEKRFPSASNFRSQPSVQFLISQVRIVVVLVRMCIERIGKGPQGSAMQCTKIIILRIL